MTKPKITVTVDQALLDYAEELVKDGRSTSVSAVISAALADARRRDLRAAAAWAAKVQEARQNPDTVARVARMRANIAQQLQQKGFGAA